MLISYKHSQTSIILRVKILDSAATTGAGKTGLTSASSGLIISTIASNEETATAYTVAAGSIETITTLGTYAAPTSGKCRFKEVDATNHKGVYEIHIADARYAVSSARHLLISISGASGAAECDALIPLTQLDPYDAVRAGLTAIPNVASGSANSLARSSDGSAITVATGKVVVPDDQKVDLNTIKTQSVTLSGGVTIPAATLASTTNITGASGVTLSSAGNTAVATAVEAAVLDEGDATALLTAIAAKVEEFIINEGDAAATMTAIAAAVRTNLTTELGRIDANVSSRASQTSVDDLPTNSELATALASADDATLAAIAALDFATPTNVTDAQTAIIAQVDANEVKIDNIQTSINTIDGIVDNILIDTNELQTDWTNGGRLDSIIDLILADTGTDGIVISSTTANQIADAILTRDWTLVSGEAARSALNALRILRNKVSESGGTLTITEEDDSTTAWTASVTTSVSANPIITIDPS